MTLEYHLVVSSKVHDPFSKVVVVLPSRRFGGFALVHVMEQTDFGASCMEGRQRKPHVLEGANCIAVCWNPRVPAGGTRVAVPLVCSTFEPFVSLQA